MTYRDKECIKEIEEKLNQALKQACVLVQNSAREKCPVDTGNLRNSITWDCEDLEGVVGTNVEYAPYVEAGTSVMQAQAFLNPALEENKDKIQKMFQGLI